MRSHPRLIKAAILICIIVLFGSAVLVAQRRRQRTRDVWLQSTSPVVELGVWRREGSRSAYTAWFVVTDQFGNEFKASKYNSTQDFVYVRFPDDFNNITHMRTSVYTLYSWKCVVEGEVVASGKFQWSNMRINILSS